MVQPYLALRTTGNGLFSCYVTARSKNPLPLGMGSVKSLILWCLVAAKRIIHDTSKNDILS